MNNFELASKQKLRFDTAKGSIATEDLWDLSLTSLDNVAKAVNKKLKEDSEDSFLVPNKTKANAKLELQLDILKHIITFKLEEADKAKNKAEKDARLSNLKDILETKKSEALLAKTPEEIQQLIDETERM